MDDFLSNLVTDSTLTPIDLGCLGQDRLGFTDVCLYEGSIWFLAVAERTDSTYDDGAFAGAILGRLDSGLKVQARYELNVPYKPEGLVIEQGRVFLVTDADDRSVPSRFYRSLAGIP